MSSGKLVFSQVIDHLPLHTFRQCVKRYRGNHKIKTFTCLDQFLCMAFAQLTYRESLRDIEACLRAQSNKLYHMGIRSQMSRNTLSNANKVRDWRIYADLAHSLIPVARKLYQDEDFGLELDQTVYALDATTIDLCLSLFPWAEFRQTKSAIKLHTLLDLRGSIPTFHLHLGRQGTRSQHPRRPAPGSRCHLRHGSWLSRLLSSVPPDQGIGLLRDPRQEQPGLPKTLLRSCQPGDRPDLRPDHQAYGPLFSATITRRSSAGSRCATWKPAKPLWS